MTERKLEYRFRERRIDFQKQERLKEFNEKKLTTELKYVLTWWSRLAVKFNSVSNLISSWLLPEVCMYDAFEKL